jgi:hypothetical protein
VGGAGTFYPTGEQTGTDLLSTISLLFPMQSEIPASDYSSFHLLSRFFLFCLFFDHEDGSDKFLQIVG